jgi:hypothetical protein
MRLKDSDLARLQLYTTIPKSGKASYTEPIPIHLLQVFPASGAFQQRRYHSRAILSFAPSDFETDKVNPWALVGLLSHIQRTFKGKRPVHRTSSNGNDRSLVLNYTVSLPDTTLDQANKVYESRMAKIDKYLGEDDECFAVDTTGVAHFGFDPNCADREMIDPCEDVQLSPNVSDVKSSDTCTFEYALHRTWCHHATCHIQASHPDPGSGKFRIIILYVSAAKKATG